MFQEMMPMSQGGSGNAPSVKDMTYSQYVETTGTNAVNVTGLTVGKTYLIIVATAWSNGNWTVINPVVTSGASDYTEISRIEHQVTVSGYSRFDEVTAKFKATSSTINIRIKEDSGTIKWYYWIIEVA